MHKHYQEADALAQALVERLGKVVVMGVPLGMGKPLALLNAFYRLAEQDSSITLTIITGLTLARPHPKQDLEKRFLEPVIERLLGDYQEPLYEQARRQGKLPANIRVLEFFLSTGSYLGNAQAQQDYISSNYTSVVNDAIHQGINLFAQTVAPGQATGTYSLSCNTDLFHEAYAYLKNHPTRAVVAELNPNLPFMPGSDAVVAEACFNAILDSGDYTPLFPLPREELNAADHLMALYTSALIKDGSCIQIGIGKLNSAITAALLLRQQDNVAYRHLMEDLTETQGSANLVKEAGGLASFDQGLYASTEMFSDDYLELYHAGILKKRVYDHVGLQQLLNKGEISETVNPQMLEILLKEGWIHSPLTPEDLAFLHEFGILKSGQSLVDLNDKTLPTLFGTKLKGGKVLHAGFFLGTADFYQALKTMPAPELESFDMTRVARTNALSWSYELAKAQRQEARFINFSMMLTLGGAVISDGLKDLQEVSGVGGQFNFVNMARLLPKARSIIACRAIRESAQGLSSNIVWEYPNITQPRHLRDIFVSEYGIADCRSKTDSEVIKALLNISDSRFQTKLMQQAKAAGKLEADYQIPKAFRDNLPEMLEKKLKSLRAKGYCQPYPFGCDLTEDELVLSKALTALKNASALQRLGALLSGLTVKNGVYQRYLSRMQLAAPSNLKERVYRWLILGALKNKGQK